MLKKKKFKPIITRVKLNPEQAVLECTCYSGNEIKVDVNTRYGTVCNYLGNAKSQNYWSCAAQSGPAGS